MKAKNKVNSFVISEKFKNISCLMMFAALTMQSQVMDFACSSNIWDKGKTTFKGIYDNVLSISIYVAAAFFIIALLVSFFVRDQRKVEVFFDWAKRIIFVYLIILGAGWLFAYGRELVSGAPDIFGTGGN